ncbi:betaine-aldehyde dehydrogenase [Thozetella sp. PMI_491]|nr:betaine-aldehyde dehydrogenase [Thozetella sp. PMI_491]
MAESTNEFEARQYLPENLGLYFNGAFHEPKDGEYKEIISPVTGKAIAKVAFAGPEDTVAALETAEKAFESWRDTSTLERCNLLRKAAQVVRDHAEELAMLDAWNIGSPVAIMRQEIEYCAMNLDLFAGLMPAVTGETQRLTEDMFHYTLREPLGVVARIVAYNHPLLMVGAKLAPPLVAGNTIVMKAAEQAPLSALRLMELIGPLFPPGVVNVLAGGKECGQTLSSHPLVKKITLVGSVPIGRAISRAAADTLKLTIYELGGKNALVAYPDAEKSKLVDGIVKGMNWAWCGQSCSSTSRVFLHESIHDDVLKLVVDKITEEHQPGNPLDPKTTMGALVDQRAVERVKKYIDIAKGEGAKLVLGGHAPELPDPLSGGCFMTPTVFSDVQQSMRIAQEEVFGPIMSVLKWTDEEELWKQVNSVEYGLTGSIYTSNTTTAQKAVKKMEAGYVWVNTSSTHFLGIPFGGYKQSGMGREHSLHELYDWTQTKAVHMNLG